MRLHSDRRAPSIWAALANATFRKLWMAAVISGTCVAAHDTAATWMMNVLTPSPFLISLLSTVASLPFFLFTLPAGALADMVDRRKLLCVVNLWLAASAAGLAILCWLHLLTPYVILAFVFLIGIGFALNAPAWTSSVSGIVLNAELPSAATLGGLQLNISGIIGPALGGLLVAWIGPNSVFCFEHRVFPGCDCGCPAMEESGRTIKDWLGEPVGFLLFERDKQRIACYVSRSSMTALHGYDRATSEGIKLGTCEGRHVAAWDAGHVSYLLVGDLTKDAFVAAANEVAAGTIRSLKE